LADPITTTGPLARRRILNLLVIINWDPFLSSREESPHTNTIDIDEQGRFFATIFESHVNNTQLLKIC
jgi:hypothetical protein